MRDTIFRQEAINARRSEIYGNPLDVGLPHLRIVYAFTLLFFSSILALLIFGQLPKYVSVRGTILPNDGLTKIQVQRSGTVRNLRVQEGHEIQAGTPLFSVVQDHFVIEGQDAATEQRESLQKLLLTSRENLQRLPDDIQRETENLQAAIGSHEKLILTNKDRQLKIQQRHQIKLNEVVSLRKLESDGFVNRKEVSDAETALLILKEQLADSERIAIELDQKIREMKFNLANLDKRSRESSISIQRSIAEIENQRNESALNSHQLIVSPIAGRVVGLAITEGQSISARETLLQIMPQGSQMTVQLTVPSRSMGLVQVGQKVRYALDPYPASLHGYLEGRVQSISQMNYQQRELQALDLPPQAEAAYRVIVPMESREQRIEGKNALLPGTGVEARIIVQDRRVYEWMFEPLLRMWGRTT